MSQSDTASSVTFKQVHIEPELTLKSAIASISTYEDFAEDKPLPSLVPEGYEYVDRFTGCTKVRAKDMRGEHPVFESGPEERFGLIFKSCSEDDTYLIAFRGTASGRDWIKNLDLRLVPFCPHNAAGFPNDVMVAKGFNDIYSNDCPDMPRSMQTQLFGHLKNPKLNAKKLYVTGHSLGGALASLFALDVAVSRPDLRVVSTTFASPRVGTEKWQSTYDKDSELETATFRVANRWDWVPAFPDKPQGESEFGKLRDYTHIGQQFKVEFSRTGEDPRKGIVPNHSVENYQTVLSNAVCREPQCWTGNFPDATNRHKTMASVCPDSSEMPLWSDIMREAEESAMTLAQ